MVLSFSWNEWVQLPVKYQDLPRNAQVMIACKDSNLHTKYRVANHKLKAIFQGFYMLYELDYSIITFFCVDWYNNLGCLRCKEDKTCRCYYCLCLRKTWVNVFWFWFIGITLFVNLTSLNKIDQSKYFDFNIFVWILVSVVCFSRQNKPITLARSLHLRYSLFRKMKKPSLNNKQEL